MNFAICPLSIVPVRSSASEKSEMVTQLLFGEMVEILEKKGSWAKIRCAWDNYLGWVDAKQIKPITPSEFSLFQKKRTCSLELVQPIIAEDHYLPVVMGSDLPNYDGLRFSFNGNFFSFSGQVITPGQLPRSAEFLLKIARRYLHAPYLWGGRSPLGIDCSGFTQMAYKLIGVNLPRDTYEQVEMGEIIDFIEQTQDGDLAFFENRKGSITHTGIIIHPGQIIHASGKVRVDKIDHFGIFNEETGKYTHKLRVIKRILPTQFQASHSDQKQTVEVDENQVKMF